MDDIMQDERFKHARTDPRFRRMPKKKKKVVISQRFKEIFEDEDFATNYTLDKRGASIKSKSRDHLKELYQIEDSDEDNTDAPTNQRVDAITKGKGGIKSKLKKSQLKPSKGKLVVEKKKKASKGALRREENDENSDEDGPDISGMDLARGRILLSSSSEESGSEAEDETEEEDEESSSDAGIESSEEEVEEESEESNAENVECTKRLAVLNLDWDRMKAADIFFALNSFKPSTGFIRSVKIYPSEFGLKRLAEEKFGPPELRKEMLNSLAELRARALARYLGRTQPGLPPARLEKRSRRLLKLARQAAAAVMAEDVERGYLDQASTEKRVYDHLDKLVEKSGMFSQLELEQVKDVQAKAPSSPSETDPTSKSRNKKQQKWDDEEEEDDKMKEKQREKLRKYELQRLKYYYAVVECDSAETAEYIHNQCQGREFESSAVTFNFQVIEDDEVFDQNPTDECHVIPSTYRPNFFLNTALCQVKVESRWDETDRERTKLLTKKMKKREEVNADDLEQYIASNSDEDYADDNEDGGGKKKDMEKVMTWDSGLKKVAADLVKKTDMKSMTLWQQHQEKVKERRKKKKQERRQERKQQARAEAAFSDDDMPDDVDLDDPYFAEELNGKKTNKKKGKKKSKKEEETSEEETEEMKLNNDALELLLMDEEEEDRQHFNLREIEEAEAEAKKKKKKRGRKQLRKPVAAQEQDDFELNLQDPRWQVLFTDPDFNLEPTNPNFKNTKATKTIIEEKLRRRKRENQAAEEQSRKRLHLS